MKVLLVDVDSKIPNLALMKLSAWHKSQGDLVSFNESEPDIVYASVVFKKNKHMVDGLKLWYPNAEVIIGGSGYDISRKLPPDVEPLKPDYSLYPEMDYSLGFTSRGCIRNCYFCTVPKKEGKYQRWQHPSEFHEPSFKKCKILDNNWYADKEWFILTSQWFIDNNIALDVTQGMDIRLMDDDIAKRLSEMKAWGTWTFAFDDMKSKDAVLKGIEILKKHITDLKHKLNFYVYIDNDDMYDDAVERCRILKEQGCCSFVMFNIDRKKSHRIALLQHWANRRLGYWSCDIKDYSRSIHK